MVDVLIAEDVTAQAGLLELFVQSEHTVVGVARDGDQAVELAKLVTPDVVVMDLNMPKKNGIEATKEVTGLFPAIRVIISTGVVDDTSHQAALDAGAETVLTKPFSDDELLDAIETVT